MEVHNIRSPEQWEIISRHVDFKGKSVLDLGCGEGDILFRAFEAGAQVTGIDKDKKNVEYIRSVHPRIVVVEEDLDFLSYREIHQDIVICFSVLPYLDNPGVILQWMCDHSAVAFIECQYADDGPGLSFLTGNDDMEAWLLEVGQFQKVQPIGHTLVAGRNKNRFIWRCERVRGRDNIFY